MKLLDRLQLEFGVKGVALDWLSSYQGDRQQYVKGRSATALVIRCTKGVPQESFLSPLLFSVYVAPVTRIIDAHGVHHLRVREDR